MRMPCEGCGQNKEYGLVKMRFVGGLHVSPSGPYAQYETGKIYEVSTRFMNREAYPYWEPVDEEEECLECDEEDEAEEEFTDSTDISGDDFTLSSDGLTVEFGQEGSKQEIIEGMDIATLRSYIRGNGGKVDTRWGQKRLIKEALKL